MRNQGDETSRVHAASDRAKPYLKQAQGRFGDFRGWCSKHLPVGERTMWVVLGLILLVLFVWAILPSKNAATQGGAGMNGPQPVGVAKAVKGDIDITLDALGTVTPLATVTIRPQVSGQIVRVDFQEGQPVQAGDLGPKLLAHYP